MKKNINQDGPYIWNNPTFDIRIYHKFNGNKELIKDYLYG